MNIQKSTVKKVYEILVALVTWVSLGLQIVITTLPMTTLFSYFTILSNLLVALSLTMPLIMRESKIGKYFDRNTVKSAITLYIFIVGLIYNLVLRDIWAPQGLNLLANNLLHVVVPILYSIYWLVFIPRNSLTWGDALSWTYFPFLYLIYSLVRGHFVGWYPYPFLDVLTLGYPKALLNIGFVVMAFLMVSFLMIAFNRLLKK